MGAIITAPLTMMSIGLTTMSTSISAFCCCCQGLMCACSTARFMSCCFRNSLGRKTGVSPRMAKIFYIIILGCATLLALILRFNSESFDLGTLTQSCSDGMVNIPVLGLAPQDKYVYCRGDAAVYRISFVMTVFFGLMVILSTVSEGLNRGYWIFKILAISGGVIGSFFMPSDAFDNQSYAWVARIGSIFFLILQILVLIDFAYNWNDDWVGRAYKGALTENAEPTDPKWLHLVLASAFLLYVGSIVGIALLYAFYSSCGIGAAFTTITLLFAICNTVISLFRDKIVGVQGAILPAAVVTSYTVFLGWSSLESNTDSTCKPQNQQTAASIIIGGLIAVVSLCWATFSLTDNALHLVRGEDLEKPPEETPPIVTGTSSTTTSGGAGAPVTSKDVEANNNAIATDEEDDEPYPVLGEKPWAFHLICVCGSMYVAMLFTDWGAEANAAFSDVAAGAASMWVKIVAEWVTSLLFMWTLIAPKCLEGRDFS